MDKESRLLTFKKIFTTNRWSSNESCSGPGSEKAQALEVAEALITVIDDYSMGSLLDAPCGDMNWIVDVLRTHPQLRYFGVDIVPEVVIKARQNSAGLNVDLKVLDIVEGTLPRADLLLCRDCLVHMPLEDGLEAIKNFCAAKPDYIMITQYNEITENKETVDGHWRPLNLYLPPFNLPPSERYFSTDYRDGGRNYPGNGLGLWSARTLTEAFDW